MSAPPIITPVKLPLLISKKNIGRGVFGSIYPVLGQSCVLKLMRKTQIEDKYALIASELSKICPNFAITLKIFNIEDPFALRSFLVGKAVLDDTPICGHVIEKLETIENWNLNYFKQALIAIMTLNENNIFHNDAHPGNFLIKRGERGERGRKEINLCYYFGGYKPIVLKSEGIIKLCDFGMTSKNSTLFSDPRRLIAIEEHKIAAKPDVYNSISDAHHLCQRLPPPLVAPFVAYMADIWSKIAIEALTYREPTKRLYELQIEELENIIRFVVHGEPTIDRHDTKNIIYEPFGEIKKPVPSHCLHDDQQQCIENVQYRIIDKYVIEFSKAYRRIPEFYGSFTDKRKKLISRLSGSVIIDKGNRKRRRDSDDIGPINIKRNIKISPIT